ncbi:amino acid transporter [Bacillus sp. ISL-18]|uniref:amino acid transporter n=1 Tax=Bacillus sp. ISL-18 TaxID=2819118 RepID=UPI001BECBBDD|nr:amino acid transporter [Bacillus sp. ISL-18]MBT2656709.1 amino acid transporter [Bacillus sp. ISL-18]
MKEEKKPFNDVIDHFNKIEGNATNPTNAKLKRLPKPLKYFGYFMIGFLLISFLLVIVLNLLD